MPFHVTAVPLRAVFARRTIASVAAGTGIVAAIAHSTQVAHAESDLSDLTSSPVLKPGLAIGTNWLVMKGAAWGIPNMIYIGALLGADVNKAYTATFDDEIMFFETDGQKLPSPFECSRFRLNVCIFIIIWVQCLPCSAHPPATPPPAQSHPPRILAVLMNMSFLCMFYCS